MGRSYLIEEEDASLIRELAKTISPTMLAHKWDVSATCMDNYCRAHGISCSNIMRKYRIDTIYEFAHLSTAKIAAKLGVATSTVRRLRSLNPCPVNL